MVVAALLTAGLLFKSTGRLNDYVRVVADLVNVGDGLPQKSDVKYHGVLVGMVDGVVPAANGKPNYVHIDLKPEYATSIPAAVTARVVPSNVFAVSSVQLVGSGPAGPDAIIRAGAHIREDRELPTVLFQTTISKLRDLLAAGGRGREDRSVGILAALGAATDHRRVSLLNSGTQLNRLIDQLNSIVSSRCRALDGNCADRRDPGAAGNSARPSRRAAPGRRAHADLRRDTRTIGFAALGRR